MVRLPQGSVVQSLVTNTSTAADAYASGQPVTVCLPPESLRVLAASPNAPQPALAHKA
jgi:hypothetical protein